MSRGPYLRKVNEALRHVDRPGGGDGSKDPGLGFVTITGVDASPDLRSARVYCSVLGDEARRRETPAASACGRRPAGPGPWWVGRCA